MKKRSIGQEYRCPVWTTVLFFLSLLVSPMVHAQSRMVRGMVRDSITADGLPFASIRIEGTRKSAVTDSLGIFEIVVPPSGVGITASSQGYARRTVPIGTNSFDIYDIYLPPLPRELDELIVEKKKYSKRNNPAVDFARRLRMSRKDTDPHRNPWYSYRRYERISSGIAGFDPDSASYLMRKFPFLKEHVDTSELSGRPVLNVSLGETASRVLWRSSPESEKEVIEGKRDRGVGEISGQGNMQVILKDLLREIDLYDSDIALLRNRFVSPLSPIAPDFYRFYLVDTVKIDGVDCVALAFYPRNKASNGFSGHVYVDAGDTTMFIRKVEMRTPREINLNFINDLMVTQTFGKAPDGSSWKQTDDLILEAQAIAGTPPVYVSRKISYRDHSYVPPSDADMVFGTLGHIIVSDSASVRDEEFWESELTRPEPTGESRIGELTRKLRGVPLYYYGEKVLKYMVTGYVPTGKESKFDYGPLNTTMSYNSLEGIRIRGGGMTTANLSPHWFGRGYVAYGFRDRKMKYGAEIEYSFNRKKYHSREFPVHSLRFSHKYDVDHLGSHYLFTSQDNFVLSLTRMSNKRDTYRRASVLEYTLELNNNFSIAATLENIRQESSPYLQFIDGAGHNWGHYTENVLGVTLRYAPGETFVQGRTYRIPVNEDVPVFVLSHKFAPKGLFGSRFSINKTEFNFTKRFWLSVAGCVDVMVGAGHVWSSSPFPDLLIPNANLSYTIQPQSFALMNPLEFINSSYVSWDLTYRAHGLLFNLVPGFKKLGLREIVGFRGLYGHLSKRNTPGIENPELFLFPADSDTRPMDHGPYMELSAGLDNIFKILRVDYVWRLSYRDVPYKIDRNGVRIALHFTF